MMRKSTHLLAVAALASALAGCQQKSEEPGSPPPPAEAQGAQAVAPPAGDFALRGMVSFEGKPPERKKLKMETDPFCAQGEARSESVVVTGGRLQNVVVHVVSKDLPKRRVEGNVVVDQAGCMYRPRVQCSVAGQTVEFRNSDATMHNVHAYEGAGRTQTVFNRAQLSGAPPFTETFTEGGKLMHFTCDVHPWMSGYVFVSENGRCAVTDEKGAFEIEGLPAGHHKVTTWHEIYGEKHYDVSVEAGAGGVLEASYSPSDRAG